MSTKKGRLKLKDKIDTPLKNEQPINLSYVKKSLLTSSRRVGLSKKKPSLKIDTNLVKEDNINNATTHNNDSVEDWCQEPSTSKTTSSSPTIPEEKPKSSTSRRKKSSHPLKRNISDTNSSSEIVQIQIVSPVSKRRKLDIIDIFNPDKIITNDKKVINNSDKINSPKNKNGNSLTVSLPLNISKNVLNLSKKFMKEDKGNAFSEKVPSNDNVQLENKVSCLKTLKSEDKPLKKRKIEAIIIQNDKEKDLAPSVTKKGNADIKTEKKTEIDANDKVSNVKMKHSNVVKKVKGRMPKIKLAQTIKSPDLNEIKLPRGRGRPKGSKSERNNKRLDKSRKKSKSNGNKTVDNNFTLSATKSKQEKNDITITVDKPPPQISNNCNLNNESSSLNNETHLQINDPEILENTTTTEHINETNLETEKSAIVEEKLKEIITLPEKTTIDEALPEKTTNDEAPPEENSTEAPETSSEDKNIIPHIRNKAEKKIYTDVAAPSPEVIFTPPRNKSPLLKNKADRKMDCDQLSEESYESSHYSPPAYSPIEARLEDDIEHSKEVPQECVSSFVEPIVTVEQPTNQEISLISSQIVEKLPEIVEEIVEAAIKDTVTETPQTETRLMRFIPNEELLQTDSNLNDFERFIESKKEEQPKKLLNYYPRVLINMDDIGNFFKELRERNAEPEREEREEREDSAERGVRGKRKTQRRRRRTTPFGIRKRRRRKNTEKSVDLDGFEYVEDRAKYKNDDDSIERIESVFFTPPSSRSENDSDSNRNDFQEVANPFGEGTSMDCITPLTSKVSHEGFTLEDKEVASLSTSHSENQSRVGSRLSEASSSSDASNGPSSSALKTYNLNENSSITVVKMGQCIEYIKWNDSAKRKSLRTVYSKSQILNRCIYSKNSEPEKITSMFDPILNEPETSSSKEPLSDLPPSLEILKQVKETESRIKIKKQTLDRLNKCNSLIKNTTELRKRAQGSLLEFAAVLRQQSGTPFNMESLLYNMSIPHHVVGYNADDDDFI